MEQDMGKLFDTLESVYDQLKHLKYIPGVQKIRKEIFDVLNTHVMKTLEHEEREYERY